jgi:hypothetical protein
MPSGGVHPINFRRLIRWFRILLRVYLAALFSPLTSWRREKRILRGRLFKTVGVSAYISRRRIAACYSLMSIRGGLPGDFLMW